MQQEHVYSPAGGTGVQFDINPANAGWKYLSFSIVKLGPGESHQSLLVDQETAIVPLSGAGTISAGDETFHVQRDSVFTQMPEVAYAPPCLLYTSPSPRDATLSRMPSSA